MGVKILHWISVFHCGMHIAPIQGLSHKKRVADLKDYLRDKKFDVIIAYSSGCNVLAALERLGVIPKDTTVVYTAPGPEKGVKFLPRDRMFFCVGKYLPILAVKSFFSRRLLLAKNDFMSLFEGGGKVEFMVDMLAAESTTLLWSQIVGQFRSTTRLHNKANRIVIRSQCDRLLGSTQRGSVAIINPEMVYDTPTAGHFGPVIDLEWVIEVVS